MACSCPEFKRVCELRGFRGSSMNGVYLVISDAECDPMVDHLRKIFGMGTGKRFEYHVKDEFGERTLVVPEDEPAFSGDPRDPVLDIEAKTNTRLKDGGNLGWRLNPTQRNAWRTEAEHSFTPAPCDDRGGRCAEWNRELLSAEEPPSKIPESQERSHDR